MKQGFYAPIPLGAGNVDGWKSIPLQEKAEPLVPLGTLSPDTTAILTSSVYYGEHSNSPYSGKNRLEGSLLTVFVRQGVATRLLKAQQLLPAGYRLLVFDAYRPLQVQESLFRLYRNQLRLERPDMNKEALSQETQKYVSVPSSDPARPSPHSTGGSVDLAVVKLPARQSALLSHIDNSLMNEHVGFGDRMALEEQKSALVRWHAEMLDFGTPYDHGGERAAVAYFEKRLAAGLQLSSKETTACDNRRLLYAVMMQVGMQAYEAEWWHYNAPESQMGAAAAGSDKATYGAITLDAENIAHEKLRQKIYREVDDLRTIAHSWPTEIISPQKDAA